MKDCLDLFCSCSGQQVSFEKSRVYCSRNLVGREARELARACGSPITSDLGNYLGVPLIHGRVSSGTYRGIVERVNKRLASWKCGSLNLAGRVTLVKAVTSALPVYVMQSVKLPGEICSKIDTLNKNFVWGHSLDSHSRGCSSSWRAVKFGMELLNKGMSWRLGCGDVILFWKDNWVPGVGTLLQYAVDRCVGLFEDDKVSDFIVNGCWNVVKLTMVLPNYIVDKISCMFSSARDGDKQIWGLSKSGEFSVKFAYNSLVDGSEWRWRFIWGLHLPPKILHFLWILLHGRLLTNC
ncbi:hypothetical protein ACOSP7_012152 [Xanthoceras sorbifolium]